MTIGKMIALTGRTSVGKVMLKNFQVRLQQFMKPELPDVHPELCREGRAPLQTKQGNRPTGHDQEGRRGLNEVESTGHKNLDTTEQLN